MSDHDGTLELELARTFREPRAEPDWQAVRRAARRPRAWIAAAVVAALVAVFGVVPALGVGRDVLWRQADEHPEYGYTYAAVDTPHGRLEFRATRGEWLGLSEWLNGRLLSSSGGPDASLHGVGKDGPRYLGFGVFRAPRMFQTATGAIANEVRSVEIRFEDGSAVPATIVAPPKTIHTDLRFYYAVIPPRPRIAEVRAKDEHGHVLERHQIMWPPFASRTYRFRPKRRG